MREEVYTMIQELYAALPYELPDTPSLEDAAHSWLLALITRDQHHPEVVVFVLEQVEQPSEWEEDVSWYDNEEELVSHYAEAREIIAPFVDRLACLK